jgi:hypothetical protein
MKTQQSKISEGQANQLGIERETSRTNIVIPATAGFPSEPLTLRISSGGLPGFFTQSFLAPIGLRYLQRRTWILSAICTDGNRPTAKRINLDVPSSLGKAQKGTAISNTVHNISTNDHKGNWLYIQGNTV